MDILLQLCDSCRLQRKVQAINERGCEAECGVRGDKKEMGFGDEELEKVFEGCTDPCSLIVNI
jgi:hypothetical protein